MTTSSATADPAGLGSSTSPGSGIARHPFVRVLLMDPTRLALGLIVLMQALWFGLILGSGWYSEADLPNLGAATGQPLNWHYLSGSLGGHFGALGRLVYWLLNRIAPLNWQLTVLLRLTLQVIATLLLWRLLVLLVGRRPWLLALLALYAVNPLLVPGLAWLTSGVGLAAAQVCVLLMLIAQVRYTRDGHLRWALLVALCALISLSFADQTVCCLLLLPLLTFGFLQVGSAAERLAAVRSRWPGWAALAAALAIFLGFYLTGSYNTGTNRFGLAAAWSITRSEWLEVFGTAFVGGPWRWAWNPDSFVSFSTPPTAAVLAGQLVLFVLVVLSFRVRGWQAVLAWAMPALIAISSVVLVGRGRYDVLGTFVSPLLRYSFYLALALPIGAALAFAPALEETSAARVLAPAEAVSGSTAEAGTAPAGWLQQWLAQLRFRTPVGVAVLLIFGASLFSGARFADRFWQNPAHGYVTNLVASARAGGPTLNVYDSDARSDVVSFVEPNRFISDILGLAGTPVRYGVSGSEPLVAGLDGRLVPATFFKSADSRGVGKPGCGTYIHGVGDWTIPLSRQLPARDWFVRLELYQPVTNSFVLGVRDAAGRSVVLPGGSQLSTSGELVTVLKRLDFVAPASITVHSSSAATNFCLVHTYVGIPLPKSK